MQNFISPTAFAVNLRSDFLAAMEKHTNWTQENTLHAKIQEYDPSDDLFLKPQQRKAEVKSRVLLKGKILQ